jgi:hypothetical protein
MSFDMGFNFRGTAGYVTDQAYAVPVLGEAYPHTYTNGNGDSVNAGWTSAPAGIANRAAGNDARLAGINYSQNNLGACDFQVDLSSGSAPGAGTYTIDLAFGDASFANDQDFRVLDNTTILIDGGGGTPIHTATGHYLDATVTDVAATTSWTGTTVNKTFATTTCLLRNAVPPGAASNSTAAHFRLTAAGAAVPDTPIRPRTMVKGA